MKEVVGSAGRVAHSAMIRIVLTSPDVPLEDCAKNKILFVASVCFNGVIATKLKFIASCSSLMKHKVSITREDILCWSPYARTSKWVENEWRYALPK